MHEEKEYLKNYQNLLETICRVNYNMKIWR